MAKSTDSCTLNGVGVTPENALSCFISINSSLTANWQLKGQTHTSKASFYGFKLSSQFWPEKSQSSSGMIWKHRLILIVPDEIKNDQAILFNAGGNNRSARSLSLTRNFIQFPKWNKILKQNLFNKFMELAVKYGSVVGVLLDNPNEYTAFDDGVPRREDGIVAYSWNKYLDDPEQNAYWPIHLPMAKANIMAMNAIQELAQSLGYRKPKNFIVSGESKRGWAAWMTSLADNRVNGVIPIVIDIFNMKKNIKHIHQFYGEWPEAFDDYVEQGVTERLDTSEFDKLIQVEDPVSYKGRPDFKERLNIPKLIISSANDEFFPPDSSAQYLTLLPGDNAYRMFPNQSHIIQDAKVVSAISDFYGFFLENKEIPKIDWQKDKATEDIKVTTHFMPQGKVILWQANNPQQRDFRFANTGIHYVPAIIEGECDSFNNTCTYTIPKFTGKGFASSFIAFKYHNGEQQMTLTSPAFVAQGDNVVR